MTVPFNFATQSGNIPLSELDANFANVSASTLTATYVTGNNQSNITAVGTLNSLSAYGNVTAGNVSTNGIVRANAVIGVNYTGTNVSVTGNITGNNIIVNGTLTYANLTFASISVTGNVTGGNLVTAGLITAVGNVTGGNLVTAGLITAVGNINGGNVNTGNLTVNHIYSDDSTYVTVNDGLEVVGDLISDSLDVTGNISGYNLVINTIASDDSTAVSVLDDLSVYGDIDVIGDISATGNVRGGNLVIPNGKKITGDFGTSVAGGRTVFQSSVANSATLLTAVPNGLNANSGLVAYNSSNTVNYTAGAVIANSTAVAIRSANFGSASPLPILIETGNSVRATFDINGNVGIGNTTPVDTLSVGGNAYVSGAVKTTPTALANLTAVAGARAFINNANLVAASNFGTLVGSGGSNVVPVWSDGSNWYIG
jgi:hypothetical protein